MVCLERISRTLRLYLNGSLDPLPERIVMQILHPFLGSLPQYAEAISDPNRYRPECCPHLPRHGLTEFFLQ